MRPATRHRLLVPPRRPAPSHHIARWIGAAIATLLVAVVLTLAGTAVAVVAVVQAMAADLPDPGDLEHLDFAQPTVVFDRSGQVELGRFAQEQRRVVTFPEVSKLILDATVTAEDRSFWENDGYDPAAIVSAVLENVGAERDRGASTITQQLVRARLLPADATAPGADRYVRKAKEIIQSARLTEAFPGETGKERIITAYLNEIFYGHGAYGIAAAAKIYFGVDLDALTPAQAAMLAGLPKSPTTLDPYRYAVKQPDGTLVVPRDAPPVARRDWILQNLSASRWTRLSPAELTAALATPVVLAGVPKEPTRAPQFLVQVRRQLESILGSADAVTAGGYQVTTTLDWTAQQLAEKWLAAGVIAPNLPKADGAKLLDQLEIPKRDRAWISRLRGKDVHDGALSAIDYRTGDVLAYAGSAGFTRTDLASPKFDPEFDVLSAGPRQPGSAFKPVVYGAAFDRGVLTPGSLLLDVTTRFSKGWTPRDADQLERGPVLVRTALQQSLNLPAIRAFQRVGAEAVSETASKLGMRFPDGLIRQAGLAAAIGTVEIRPIDMVGAFGAIANGGVRVPTRIILEVRAPDGHVVYRAPDPQAGAVQAMSPQAAYLVTDILAGNTDPHQNPGWARVLQLTNGPRGEARPAAVKTGTTNDARDLSTYGYLAPPEDPTAAAIAVGVWMGNSDHSAPKARELAFSLDGPAPIWQAFVRQLTDKTPVSGFARPGGLVRATIDAWSGGAPGAWTRARKDEWFIDGTQPGGKREVDPAGLLYDRACRSWAVDPVRAEVGPAAWKADVQDWLARARKGPGVKGPLDSKTAYLPGERSWGGPLTGPCPKPKPKPTPAPSPPPGGPGGHGGGGGPGHGGGGGGGGGGGPTPSPTPTPTPAPSPSPRRRRGVRERRFGPAE